MSDLLMRVVDMRWVRASDIKPHPDNWRSHPDNQRAAYGEIVASVGFAGSLLTFTDTNGDLVLIDGEMRLEAHPDSMLPAIVTDLNEEEALQVLATFDPVSTLAGVRKDRLEKIHRRLNNLKGRKAELLKSVRDRAGVDIDDEPEPAPEAQIDRAADFQEKWQVERGDIWTLTSADGQRVHKIMCGDSTNAGDVELLMSGEKMQGVFTSPPYAMQRKNTYGGIPTDDYVDWWDGVQSCVKSILKDDGSFFVNIKPHFENGERVLYVFDLVLAMKRHWGWKYIDEFCWSHSGIPGRYAPRFKNQFEPIYFWSKTTKPKARPDNVKQPYKDVEKSKRDLVKYGKGQNYSPTGSGININYGNFINDTALPGNVLNIPQDAGFLRDDIIQKIHSATFPLKLPLFFINAYSDDGDRWYDPFLGSGTTICACEQTARVGYGMEIHEPYVAVCLERLSAMGLDVRRI